MFFVNIYQNPYATTPTLINVDLYCPECFAPPKEERGIYYCSRCGLVLGVEFYYGAAAGETNTWKTGVQREVAKYSENVPINLKRRASYIANKIKREYNVSGHLAAIAGLIAAYNEWGVKRKINAPKTTIRKAKSILARSRRERVVQIKTPKDPYMEDLYTACTKYGVPLQACLEIYERYKDALRLYSHKPSTVVMAIGHLLNPNMKVSRAAAKLSKEIYLLKKIQRGVFEARGAARYPEVIL
jgi:hypothetical protein